MYELLRGIWQDVKVRLGQAWTLVAPRIIPHTVVWSLVAAGVWGWYEFVPEDGMFAAAAVTTAQALFKATAGVAMVFGTLKLFDDNIDGDSFGQTFKTASPALKMAYFTGRFVGVCILYGMVLSG